MDPLEDHQWEPDHFLPSNLFESGHDFPKENLLDFDEFLTGILANCNSLAYNAPYRPEKLDPLVPIDSCDLNFPEEDEQKLCFEDASCVRVEKQLEAENADHELLKLTKDAQVAKKRRTHKVADEPYEEELETTMAFPVSARNSSTIRVACEEIRYLNAGEKRVGFFSRPLGDGTTELLIEPITWIEDEENVIVTIFTSDESLTMILRVVD